MMHGQKNIMKQLFNTASKCQSAAALSRNFIWMPIFSAGRS